MMPPFVIGEDGTLYYQDGIPVNIADAIEKRQRRLEKMLRETEPERAEDDTPPSPLRPIVLNLDDDDPTPRSTKLDRATPDDDSDA